MAEWRAGAQNGNLLCVVLACSLATVDEGTPPTEHRHEPGVVRAAGRNVAEVRPTPCPMRLPVAQWLCPFLVARSQGTCAGPGPPARVSKAVYCTDRARARAPGNAHGSAVPGRSACTARIQGRPAVADAGGSDGAQRTSSPGRPLPACPSSCSSRASGAVRGRIGATADSCPHRPPPPSRPAPRRECRTSDRPLLCLHGGGGR